MLERGARSGPDKALALSITGLALSVPATLLPFVSAGVLGGQRTSLLFTGVGSLWNGGMRPMAVLVFVCGWLLPLALLASFAILRAPSGPGLEKPALLRLSRVAGALERWAIPEVQVLAVLVALMKLGDSVDLTIGPGFWCYCGMALSLLVARHSFEFDSTVPLQNAGHLEVGARP